MWKIPACILALVLLASALLLTITSAAAYEKKIPCDADANNELTKEELVNAILLYILSEGSYTLDDVGDAAWVYAYWDGKPKTIVDSAGRTVTLYRPLERIAVLNWNALEVMRSLKLEKEKIICVSKSTIGKKKFFPEFKDSPNAGNAWRPDIEKILELEPDAVFLYATHFKTSCDEVQEKLEDAGITVVRFDCFKPEDYLDEVNKLGYIFDKEKEAEDFVEFYEGCLDSIKEKEEKIPEDKKTRVYFEGFGKPYKIGGKGTALHQIVEMAGGKDIFGDISGYKVMDKEEVMMRDPEVIVKQAHTRGKYGYNVDDITWLKDMWDEIKGRPGLANVSAVNNKRVYVIIKELTGGKHFIAITYMAKWFHPELFEDLDPKSIHQEYLTRFQGLDYDLDEHGVFVYHPDEHPGGK